MKIKFTIEIIVILVISIIISFYYFNKKIFGSDYAIQELTLTGTSARYASIPLLFHHGNSTTTDANNATNQLHNGGNTITQLITTAGAEQVILSITGKGGTATSTLSMQQECSMDGTYYSPFMRATSSPEFTGTSTLTLIPNARTIDLGTATTTLVYNFQVGNCNYTRLLFMGDDLSTDPNDGVMAWIRATLIEKIVR